MLSENGFSDVGPKIRFLCYQKRPFLIRHFLIKFSNSPILLDNPDFLTGYGFKNVIKKGFQFLPDDCVAAVTVAVAAYRRRKQRIKNTNQLAFVLGLPDEEDAVVSRENICM